MPTIRVLDHLIKICNQLAHGQYEQANELFRMTREDLGIPPDMTSLAEAFGMMLVQLEARDYRLEQTIAELRAARDELARRSMRLDQENRLLRQTARENFRPGRILGSTPGIQEVIRTLEKIADTPVNVLIVGETGTGKELVAKALHFNSRRADKPFVAINCSAIPESIFEAEMFGIEKGVATGVDRRQGRIELANGGTLFLDEVGDMPASAQAKILRVLEEREVERVGARKPVHVDIRVVAATHRDLRNLVAEGTFREDLYYRLNVISLKIPPLRERPDDIPLLANYYLELNVVRLGVHRPQLTAETVAALKSYDWPGNVRELENEMERAVALAVNKVISPDDLSEPLRQAAVRFSAASSPEVVTTCQAEADLVKATLFLTGNNKSKTARMLGISREGLRKKMKRLEIQ